jgi:prepilin-type N-terminal cleavage/methylation domain
MNKNLKRNQGFTLLELLIVIAIIAILSVILVLVLDPSETLKKSRDSQRMSDLSTLKTALGLYSTSVTTPYMGGASLNTACKGSTTDDSSYSSTDRIFYSLPSETAISDATLDGGAGSAPAAAQSASTTLALTNGTGWLPVNLSALPSGSPISNLPIDPVNTVTDRANVANTDLVYRYVCSEKTLRYEIDATLESKAYTVDDNKMAKDGGNNANYFEVGTDLQLLGTGTTF